MWRPCAPLLFFTACGIGFQTGDAPGGGAPSGGAGGTAGNGGSLATTSVGGAMTTTTGPGGSTSTAGGGASGGAAPTCEHGLEVAATVAECIRHDQPNPDYCEEVSSPSMVGEMDVDESADSTQGNTARAYLRFDLPPGATGATGYTLRLVNTGTADAWSYGSGELYEVQAFELADLFVAPPPRVSQTPVSPGQGHVDPDEVVDWPLPATVAAGDSISLEVAGTDANGVRYWNNDGDVPPKLLVSCQ